MVLKPLYSLTTSLLTFMGGGKRYRLILSVITTFVSVGFLLVSCGREPVSFTAEERHEADSIVKSIKNSDSLAVLQKQWEKEGKTLMSIVALREQGKALRNKSLFDEALYVHSEELKQAEAARDTLEWVQALNNIGTDYRRLGVLDVAQEYHYRAWKLSEEYSDTTFTAKKNRVMSLNGLGNIYMTIGNYNRADSALHMALAGEQELNSAVGMAINYANLGSIFEHRGQTDSAWVYYRRSMELNQKANNTLGISLCHTYFGSLYEKAKDYDKSIAEYEAAYKLMEASQDEWHALNSLIALAGIHCASGNDRQTLAYLDRAKTVAERIKSVEHQAEIYTLYYKHHKHSGNLSQALVCYERATALQDSVVDMEKINRMQSTSLAIERRRQQQQMAEVNYKLESERTIRHWGIGAFVLLLLLSGGGITALFYIQRLRARSHHALKQMSMMRETFFTNITHEFRTPLTVILGLSRELVDDEKARPTTREKAEVIKRQGNSLLTLINQLLDISKIKSSVGAPDWYAGNITTYIEMLVDSYQDYAESRGVKLQFIGKDKVEMDFVPDYVTKVLNNLLSNALKFTPEYGKIRVSLWQHHEQLRIDVSDTGRGIAESSIPHIFKPFYQSEQDAGNVGTGVGLALVKQIIDNVEGTISVESTVGKGTTFHIAVPIRHESKKRLLEDTSMMGNPPLIPEALQIPDDSTNSDADCRILIIEDNIDVAAYIGSQLTDGYAVAYAADGTQGLEKAMELVPDLIITDLMMPGMDGLEVCRAVRGNEILSHIPVIIVTAKVSEEDRVKGFEAGADAYLAKPFNHDELRVRVEKLLEQRRLLREKYTKAVTEGKETEVVMNDTDRRFLSKTVNAIYMLMEQRELNTTLLADKLCLSERQLRRKLTALTGDSPASFIQHTRMERAKQLLVSQPEWTIEVVADSCGFESYSVFYHAFKKLYNISPSQYRQEGS